MTDGVSGPPAGRDGLAGVSSPAELSELLAEQGYLADDDLAAALFVAQRMRQPLFLEGEAGVGKTGVAKALAGAVGARLVRLQCYEGIDVNQALYDWNYSRQLLYVRALQDRVESSEIVKELFGPDFLIRRPLLDALQAEEEEEEVVLLIDEIDRADDEFEAFLLELLSDFQVSIPELGTIEAVHRPVVILTSNRTREVHDALKRRCYYHWVEFPDRAREVAILKARIPGIASQLAEQLCDATLRLRELNLHKPPGMGETLDWANALSVLQVDTLDVEAARRTIGSVLKVREDQQRVMDLPLDNVIE